MDGVSSNGELLILLLGAGGATAIGAAVKAWLAIRDSAETRESKAIGNLEKWRQQADDRADRCLEQLDFQRSLVAYWSTRCAAREFQLYSKGVQVEPYAPPPRPDHPMVSIESLHKPPERE